MKNILASLTMTELLAVLAVVGLILSLTVVAYNYILMYKNDDVLYLRLALRYILASAFFAGAIATFSASKIISLVFTLTGGLLFVIELLFAKKNLQKEDTKYSILSLLEKYHISYEEFKKLCRKDQVSALYNAVIIREDGTLSKLIEKEEEIKYFECVLNKK